MTKLVLLCIERFTMFPLKKAFVASFMISTDFMPHYWEIPD